jgi:hypothetical protein
MCKRRVCLLKMFVTYVYVGSRVVRGAEGPLPWKMGLLAWSKGLEWRKVRILAQKRPPSQVRVSFYIVRTTHLCNVYCAIFFSSAGQKETTWRNFKCAFIHGFVGNSVNKSNIHEDWWNCTYLIFIFDGLILSSYRRKLGGQGTHTFLDQCDPDLWRTIQIRRSSSERQQLSWFMVKNRWSSSWSQKLSCV